MKRTFFINAIVLAQMCLVATVNAQFSQVLWEYDSADAANYNVQAINNAAGSRFAAPALREFGVPNRKLRRTTARQLALGNGTQVRLQNRTSFGQEIDPTTGKWRFTFNLLRKSRNANQLEDLATTEPDSLVAYSPYIQDSHCMILPANPFGNNNTDGFENGTRFRRQAYEVSFAVEVVDAYPATWPEADKWWNKLEINGGFFYVCQLHQPPIQPPFAVSLARAAAPSNIVYWQIWQRHKVGATVEFDNNSTNPALAEFTGPGTYEFKIKTDIRPSGKGFTQVEMRGGNNATFIEIFEVTGKPNYYHDHEAPFSNFGIYNTLSVHHEELLASASMDVDQDGIPNYADVDWDADGTDDIRPAVSVPIDYDVDGVLDHADADANSNAFIDVARLDVEFLTSSSGDYYIDQYPNHLQAARHLGKGVDDRWTTCVSDCDGDGVPDFADVAFDDANNAAIKNAYQLPGNAIDIECDNVFHEQVQLVFDKIKIEQFEFGDADMNGTVEFADYLILSHNFNGVGDWRKGDFNGDGLVGFIDYLILTNNFNGQAPPPPN